MAPASTLQILPQTSQRRDATFAQPTTVPQLLHTQSARRILNCADYCGGNSTDYTTGSKRPLPTGLFEHCFRTVAHMKIASEPQPQPSTVLSLSKRMPKAQLSRQKFSACPRLIYDLQAASTLSIIVVIGKKKG